MGYPTRLGRRARDPHVVGLLVAGAALVFTTGWLLYMTLVFGLGGTPAERAFFVGFFLLATPPNAYLVTRAAWRWFVAPHRRLSYRRAAAVGVGATLVAYVTLSLAFFSALWAWHVPAGETVYGLSGDPITLVSVPLNALFYSVLGLLYGVGLTAGVPIVLTVGIALALARWQPDRPDARSDR